MESEWKLTGLVVPFNKVIRGGTRGGAQLFRRGAFAQSLREEMIIDLCVDHRGGRNGEAICDSTGGFFAEERRDGLYFQAWPDGSIFAQRALLAVIAGRVRHCSFACHIEKSRTLADVEVVERASLSEVSLCSRPACSSTWCRAISPQQQQVERQQRQQRFLPAAVRNYERSVFCVSTF
jgi:HK97 family phage prohead protease